MWGSKVYKNRQAISLATSSIFYEVEHEIQKGFDQTILNKHILPVVINDLVIIFNLLKSCIIYFFIVLYR